MKSLIKTVLLLTLVVCIGAIAWDFTQTGALLDPVAAAQELGTSVDQTVHGWLAGLP